MKRTDRTAASMRKVQVQLDYLHFPAGSCLLRFGRTEVLCAATIEPRVPAWLAGKGRGWVSSEYSMLPASTPGRSAREATRGRQGGRTHEIQRLIGRALRAAVDLEGLGERQIRVDCDVLQADAGTRTASITGGWIALALAINRLTIEGAFADDASPLVRSVAAVSVGLVDGEPLLDLDYQEDSHADVDMNFVFTGGGGLVEVQGTAEGAPFSESDFGALLGLARQGAEELTRMQVSALGEHLKEQDRWRPFPGA